ncbi:DUF1028 domain-containing protein [Pseudorhodoplanes sinuspersici]|uniref:Uncharacterized protein n=1 Tax=Pseudorhodoplanes sinuspersici TaxID=1235591 RepID=A0A1W6ZT26_9HYPH|nr:DUF1028 domain-containing protein [Pseudorhodoplanes sinuspersici]ARQ00557.1 hypothetical protein CAK95_16850 [Pseudorhodoplanes sinuspersici]RKE72150.1 putative Ntn-hydrolase superfamily protein [Pseudorhodoplanes sinuspersici]
MTYSIAARCEKTGAFGIAITSSSICVASRCAWVGPLGAVSTQNITDPALGPAGLGLLRQGLGAGAVLDLLLAGTPDPDYRQVGVIDRYGKTALHSGKEALPLAAFSEGRGCIALGNLLASPDVPAQMVAAFEKSSAESLAERLMRGLEAGLAAGGETGDEHAAGLHVADIYDWPVVDLRVDWHDEPIGELRRIWTLYAPQRAAYESRARAPGTAPSF